MIERGAKPAPRGCDYPSWARHFRCGQLPIAKPATREGRRQGNGKSRGRDGAKGVRRMKYALLTSACMGLLAAAVLSGVAPPKAQAAVCGVGIYRAGCVGPRGAIVAR